MINKLFSFFFCLISGIVFSQNPVTFQTEVNKISENKFELTTNAYIEKGWRLYSQNLQKEMIEYTTEWSLKRSSYEYEIDGIVFKLDELNHRDRLGETAHHPRWAIAWKFPSQEANSVLLDVDWQTGRTGSVTPVARIAPQMVGGVTVENVTLHNVGEVKRLGIKIRYCRTTN